MKNRYSKKNKQHKANKYSRKNKSMKGGVEYTDVQLRDANKKIILALYKELGINTLFEKLISNKENPVKVLKEFLDPNKVDRIRGFIITLYKYIQKTPDDREDVIAKEIEESLYILTNIYSLIPTTSPTTSGTSSPRPILLIIFSTDVGYNRNDYETYMKLLEDVGKLKMPRETGLNPTSWRIAGSWDGNRTKMLRKFVEEDSSEDIKRVSRGGDYYKEIDLLQKLMLTTYRKYSDKITEVLQNKDYSEMIELYKRLPYKNVSSEKMLTHMTPGYHVIQLEHNKPYALTETSNNIDSAKLVEDKNKSKTEITSYKEHVDELFKSIKSKWDTTIGDIESLLNTAGERDNEKIKKNIEEKIKEVKLYLNPVTAAGAVAYAKSSSDDENNYNKVGIAAAASYAYENMEKESVLDTIYSLVGPAQNMAANEDRVSYFGDNATAGDLKKAKEMIACSILVREIINVCEIFPDYSTAIPRILSDPEFYPVSPAAPPPPAPPAPENVKGLNKDTILQYVLEQGLTTATFDDTINTIISMTPPDDIVLNAKTDISTTIDRNYGDLDRYYIEKIKQIAIGVGNIVDPPNKIVITPPPPPGAAAAAAPPTWNYQPMTLEELFNLRLKIYLLNKFSRTNDETTNNNSDCLYVSNTESIEIVKILKELYTLHKRIQPQKTERSSVKVQTIGDGAIADSNEYLKLGDVVRIKRWGNLQPRLIRTEDDLTGFINGPPPVLINLDEQKKWENTRKQIYDSNKSCISSYGDLKKLTIKSNYDDNHCIQLTVKNKKYYITRYAGFVGSDLNDEGDLYKINNITLTTIADTLRQKEDEKLTGIWIKELIDDKTYDTRNAIMDVTVVLTTALNKYSFSPNMLLSLVAAAARAVVNAAAVISNAAAAAAAAGADAVETAKTAARGLFTDINLADQNTVQVVIAAAGARAISITGPATAPAADTPAADAENKRQAFRTILDNAIRGSSIDNGEITTNVANAAIDVVKDQRYKTDATSSKRMALIVVTQVIDKMIKAYAIVVPYANIKKINPRTITIPEVQIERPTAEGFTTITLNKMLDGKYIDNINDTNIFDATSLNDYKYLLPVDLDQKLETTASKTNEDNTFKVDQIVIATNKINNGYKITPDKNNKKCITRVPHTSGEDRCKEKDKEVLNDKNWYKIRQCLKYNTKSTTWEVIQYSMLYTYNALIDKCSEPDVIVLKPQEDPPVPSPTDIAGASNQAIVKARYLGIIIQSGAMGRIVNIEENEYSIVFAKTKENKTTTKSLGLDIYLVKIQKNELDKYVRSLADNEKKFEKVSRKDLPSDNTTNGWLNKYYVFTDTLTEQLKDVLLTEKCFVDNKLTTGENYISLGEKPVKIVTPTVDPSLRVKKIEESQTAFTGEELTEKIKGSDISKLSTIVTDGKLEFTIEGIKIRIETSDTIDKVKEKVSGEQYELIRV